MSTTVIPTLMPTKTIPTTVIPTLIPTPTIPTSCVNCGYFYKQSWELNLMLGTLIFIRLGQVRLGQVRLGQVSQVSQVRLGQVRLGQVRLGQVRLGQLGQVWLGQVRLSKFKKIVCLLGQVFLAIYTCQVRVSSQFTGLPRNLHSLT